MTAREFSQRAGSTRWGRRPGFSLMEVLIAASLMGLVVGLAVQGFVEAKKIGDLTQSKMVARQEANGGVQKLAKILRRCHIIFFSTRPLPLAEITAATNLNTLLATPAKLKDAVSGVANDQLRSALSSPNQLIERYSSISTAPRKDFRAQDQYTGGGFDGIK
ncbi:MAG: prepilin-type N-terminal cleavage/methylation domain-containing protein, partial [Candidatus Sericytochromatia bacterium]|nr:prepilin-type N-terminal cleavage/methylation domain-containing protein [Candidatus Sericytochromatia bacterium]